MTTPTRFETRILAQAEKIKAKLQWLADHPGKTRRDYKAYKASLPKRVRTTPSIIGGTCAANAKRAALAFLQNNEGRPFSEEDVKQAMLWALPRDEDKAAALVQKILTEIRSGNAGSVA
jgi:hypothetical protein